MTRKLGSAAARKRWNDLARSIHSARDSYYGPAPSEMSDQEFDARFRELLALQADWPQLSTEDSPARSLALDKIRLDLAVRHGSAPAAPTIVNSMDELDKWLASVEGALDGGPKYYCRSVVEGFAIVTNYADGSLQSAVARGDGRVGDDITANAGRIPSIPGKLEPLDGFKVPSDVTVCGTLFLPSRGFRNLNAMRWNLGRPALPNPASAAQFIATRRFSQHRTSHSYGGVWRNAKTNERYEFEASRSQDDDVIWTYHLSEELRFLVDGVNGVQGMPFESLTEEAAFAKGLGLPIHTTSKVFVDTEDLRAWVSRVSDRRFGLGADLAGVLVAVDELSSDAFTRIAGVGVSRAVELAFPEATVESRVRRLDPRTSFQGRVGIRATVDEASMGEVTATDAWLSDVADVDSRDIRVGDTVYLRIEGFAGVDVLGPVLDQRVGTETVFTPPTQCPDCRSLLQQVDDGRGLWCPNAQNCAPQVRHRLTGIARELGLYRHMRGESVTALLASGALVNEGDLFLLDAIALRQIDYFVEPTINRSPEGVLNDVGVELLAELERARTLPLQRIVAALLVGCVTRRDAEALTRAFGSVEALAVASLEALTEIPEITEETAIGVADWFALDWHRDVIEKWRRGGVPLGDVRFHPTGTSLAGVRVVITGSLRGFTRESAVSAVVDRGGTVSSTVSSGTTIVVQGDFEAGASPKAHRAELLGIPITGVEGFRALLAGGITAVRVAEMWSSILSVHTGAKPLGTRGPLPFVDRELVLYVRHPDGVQIAAVLARNLAEAFEALDWSPSDIRNSAVYVCGRHADLRASSPLLRKPVSALKTGHPLWIRSQDDLGKVKSIAGIYRIRAREDDGRQVVYVGQAIDLRRRLMGHEKIARWGWSRIERIEVMSVKSGGNDAPWLLVDLDDAEERKIQEAVDAQTRDAGPVVVNVTIGRNGRKGKHPTHTYIWTQ